MTKDCCVHNSKDKKCLRKDGKLFNLPRRFSRESCKNPRGFTMRSSCAPYKFCNKTKQPKPDEWKIGDIDDEEDSGRKNCMQMHNSLPGHKQTTAVKNLINDPTFSGEENFINFNEDTKTKLQDESEGGKASNMALVFRV